MRDRNILDGVVIVNEVLDYVKKNGKSCMVFKTDFEKAYDSVSWEFLDYMLNMMGFDNEWRSWINACLQSSSLSVLINGSPTKEFSMSKVIRQGHPMVPFLFLIVAEGLNGIIRSAVEKNVFMEIIVSGNGQDVGILHIQYADDTILMGEMTISNAREIKCILKNFEIGIRVEGELS